MSASQQRWRPQTNLGLAGAYEINDRLSTATLWPTGGHGPVDITLDENRRAITGLDDGRIIRFPTEGGDPETIVDTGGRPLGIEMMTNGSLIVCDAEHGLLEVKPNGAIQVLADHHKGVDFKLTSAAAIGQDGSIFFSVASHRWGLGNAARDLLERSATGRLYRRAPNGELSILVDGLVFANGVALSRDEDFVLVSETGNYRIHRHWLTGAKTGTTDIFVENLPGFPDNLSRSHDIFWTAFLRLRDRMLDRIVPHPWARKVVSIVPERLQPGPGRHAMIVGFDHTGVPVYNLQDPSGRVGSTTGVCADGYRLYIGSFTEPHVTVATLPTSLDA